MPALRMVDISTGLASARRLVLNLFVPGCLHGGGAGTAQVFFESPVTTAAGLARDDQVEAGHKCDELATGAGLFAGISRNALAAATALGAVPRRQFPAVREDLRVKLPPQLGRFDIAGWFCRLFHKPLGNYLSVLPLSLVQHAIGDACQVPRRHAKTVGWMPPYLAVVVLKRPTLDPERLEKSLDGELVIRLARNVLAHQGGVIQGVSGVTATFARIERQLFGAWVTGVAQDIFPGPVVGGARRLRGNPRGMIEKLLDRYLGLARIAQRLGPGNKIKRPVIESHFAWGLALPAPF